MRTILVTGANSGVGLAVAHGLVAAKHRVILAVRDPDRGAEARARLLAEHPAADVRVEPVDLSDLRSVRALAARDFELDVLINNAGIAFEPLRLTPEGVHAQFATNHLGHFALTALLFDRLARRPDARIVTVTSTLARKGTLDLDHLDGRGFSSLRAYTQSKLANVLFAAELDRRLRARSSPAKSVLAHPGVPRTAMQQRARGFIGVVARAMSALAGKPPAHGAAPVLEAALSPHVESGDLWQPGKRLGDPPRKEAPWPTRADTEGAARLWSRSESLTALRFLP